jgi:hypothetical protein
MGACKLFAWGGLELQFSGLLKSWDYRLETPCLARHGILMWPSGSVNPVTLPLCHSIWRGIHKIGITEKQELKALKPLIL